MTPFTSSAIGTADNSARLGSPALAKFKSTIKARPRTLLVMYWSLVEMKRFVYLANALLDGITSTIRDTPQMLVPHLNMTIPRATPKRYALEVKSTAHHRGIRRARQQYGRCVCDEAMVSRSSDRRSSRSSWPTGDRSGPLGPGPEPIRSSGGR